MSTKESILFILESHKGVYYSGEELASLCNVSRTAIWKAINALKKDGYEIDAVTNRGYCLSLNTDKLSVQGIGHYLKPEFRTLPLEVFEEIGSTNTALKEKANGGAPHGSLMIAGSQTQGRGRLGRQFYSPENTGVYLSILLRPEGIPAEKAVHITTMAAVAACEAIEEASGKEARIKWVNDIFMEGKKVSGILTEASISVENYGLDYVILGIGINAYPPEGGFPENLTQIAGAVFDRLVTDGKNRLAAGFVNHFLEYYKNIEGQEYIEHYRRRSLAIGRDVRVLKKEGDRMAHVDDIDADCHLLVTYEDGSKEVLSSGEISIRL